MNKELFINEVKNLGIEVTSEKLSKLDLFYKLLIEWNEKINLTTIIEEENVYLKHFYDSLTLFRDIDLNKEIRICDVGSGAGFPGIVLKIFFPNINITLIDSLNKRIIYLNDIIDKLGLDNIKAIHSRMEDFSKIHEEEFDYITARAVSQLPILCEISVKALKINGSLVFMKANCEEELVNIDKKLDKLGLKLSFIDKFVLPIENSNRTIIKIDKYSKTNKLYPRTIDKIKKNPL
ncbi:MAG: 16S rRNA (guanine(527)-N(7))-methyltransferase RsmG [Firmicutes bacterium]|nr:16S rRNA (guanine(527)-N(7))-methyltransferase RsmG [Bacillota bacterium]